MAQATKFVEFQPAINIDEGNNGAALGFQFGFLKSVADNVEVGGGLGNTLHFPTHQKFLYSLERNTIYHRTKPLNHSFLPILDIHLIQKTLRWVESLSAQI